MRRYVLYAVLVLAPLMVYGYGKWIGSVESVHNPNGDAVVVHAGGQGERRQHALVLMRHDAADTLVIMYGERADHAGRLCGQVEPYEVLCPAPELETTIGEARAIAELVEERGWTSLITVTSDYHLRRATILDRRCSGIEVIGSAAPSGRSARGYWNQLVTEMAALPQAALISC